VLLRHALLARCALAALPALPAPAPTLPPAGGLRPRPRTPRGHRGPRAAGTHRSCWATAAAAAVAASSRGPGTRETCPPSGQGFQARRGASRGGLLRRARRPQPGLVGRGPSDRGRGRGRAGRGRPRGEGQPAAGDWGGDPDAGGGDLGLSAMQKLFPSGMHVLVVDDESLCLIILERMLQRCFLPKRWVPLSSRKKEKAPGFQ